MSLLPRLLVAISLPVLLCSQTQIQLNQSKYLASGTGAVNRTGNDKLSDIVSIKDYGGVGDGTTDNLPAINRAFAAVAGTGQRILFPAGTYGVSGTVIVPDKTVIFGVGRGDTGTTNTVIKALSNFPVGGTVIQMGPAPGPDFGIRVENMTVDGSALASTCLSNLYAEELSAGRDLLLTNCGGASLLISGGGAQNSGPFENLEIYPGGGPTVNASTVCIQVTNVIAFRGIRGVTCNPGSFYSVLPNVGLAIDGAGTYSDIHVEHAKTAITLGSAADSSDGLILENGQFGPDVQTGVAILNGFNNQNLNIFGMACVGCSSLLTDSILGNNITDSSLGWYMIGNGGGGGKNLLSSNWGVGAKFYGPLSAIGNLTVGPATGNNEGTLNIFNATPSTGVTQTIEIAGAGQSSTDLFQWRNNWNQTIARVGNDGRVETPQLNLTGNAVSAGATGLALSNASPIRWSSDSNWYGSSDLNISRASAGVLGVNGLNGFAGIKSGSVQLAAAGSQPACNATSRGTFWFVQSPSGTADHLQVCSKSAADSYSWISIF